MLPVPYANPKALRSLSIPDAHRKRMPNARLAIVQQGTWYLAGVNAIHAPLAPASPGELNQHAHCVQQANTLRSKIRLCAMHVLVGPRLLLALLGASKSALPTASFHLLEPWIQTASPVLGRILRAW